MGEERVIGEDETKVGVECGLLAMEVDRSHSFGAVVRGAKDAAYSELTGGIGLAGQLRARGDRCRIVVHGDQGAGQASCMDYAVLERWRREHERERLH